MNMSLYEIYVWLAKLDFPSLSAIWTWLITVPWWLAIGTVVVTVFAIRIVLSLMSYFLNWLFDWIENSGGWFGDKVHVVKGRTSATLEFCRLVKRKLFR